MSLCGNCFDATCVLFRWVQDPASRMWWSLIPLSCLLALASAHNKPSFHPLSDDLINYINKRNTTWQVGSDAISCQSLWVPALGHLVHTASGVTNWS